MKIGDKAIWYPYVHEGETHPWYGHTVTIQETPNNPNYPLYRFSVDDAPKVNNPKAFWFWDCDKYLCKREN